MPEIRLGPQGREIKLPAPRFRASPSWTVRLQRNIEKVIMADGSAQYIFKNVELKEWAFEWDLMTRAELDDFVWLSRFKEALRFKNTWDDETWYQVVMLHFDFWPLIDVHTDDVRYKIHITLEEVR